MARRQPTAQAKAAIAMFENAHAKGLRPADYAAGLEGLSAKGLRIGLIREMGAGMTPEPAVLSVADAITVIRRGTTVASVQPGEVTARDLGVSADVVNREVNPAGHAL